MNKKNKKKLLYLGELLTDEWLDDEINRCILKIRENMSKYGNQFPSASATKGIYTVGPNDDWTNGFWTGMLWLSYEWTRDPEFLLQATRNYTSFQQRLDSHTVLDHHDIGFLYSLSAGAGYEITGENKFKKQLINAADILLNRFQVKGEFIQAWGECGESKEYRLIIDSVINLPLLFKASILSDNPKYRDAAFKHYDTLISTVIKSDFTTYHTYYFNNNTGEPTYGATRQGNRDDSIWARGQSWGILGIPLVESYLKMKRYDTNNYHKIVDVFLDNLPSDMIPYWDFDFNDDRPSDKDSSSLAITACGLLEADSMNLYPNARLIAKGMIYQLREYCSTRTLSTNEGLITKGVYSYKDNKGVNEPNLWGDYFYLESLMRVSDKNWNKYW